MAAGAGRAGKCPSAAFRPAAGCCDSLAGGNALDVLPDRCLLAAAGPGPPVELNDDAAAPKALAGMSSCGGRELQCTLPDFRMTACAAAGAAIVDPPGRSDAGHGRL